MFRDSLECGPLRRILDLAAGESDRLAFWREVCPDITPVAVPSLVENTAILAKAPEIVIWLGTGLGDQIFLAWVVALLQHLGQDPAHLKVVRFHRNTAGTGIEPYSLGRVHPLTAVPPPEQLSTAAVEELTTAWRALTAREPAFLARFLADPACILPFLKRAVAHSSLRYPDRISGLGNHDMALLRAAKEHGPGCIHVVSRVFAKAVDTTDGPGDLWLLWRLRRLSDLTLPDPPLRREGSGFTLRDTSVHLTLYGEHVLAGTASYGEVNGINDWVGGVHFLVQPRR